MGGLHGAGHQQKAHADEDQKPDVSRSGAEIVHENLSVRCGSGQLQARSSKPLILHPWFLKELREASKGVGACKWDYASCSSSSLRASRNALRFCGSS